MTSEQWPPVYNGHYFWVPRVVVVHRFNYTSDWLLDSNVNFLSLWRLFIRAWSTEANVIAIVNEIIKVATLSLFVTKKVLKVHSTMWRVFLKAKKRSYNLVYNFNIWQSKLIRTRPIILAIVYSTPKKRYSRKNWCGPQLDVHLGKCEKKEKLE